jgi:hypothetical protein
MKLSKEEQVELADLKEKLARLDKASHKDAAKMSGLAAAAREIAREEQSMKRFDGIGYKAEMRTYHENANANQAELDALKERLERLREMEAKKPSETVDRAFAVFWFVLFLVFANVAPFALAKVIGAWPAVLLWMGALLALGLNHQIGYKPGRKW